MTGFDQSDPDIWQKKSGGGCLILFGLPFLLIGLALLLGFMEPEEKMPVFLKAFVGLAFAFSGAVIVFGRMGTTIDRRSGKVTEFIRLIFEIRKKEYSLNRYNRVTLTKELRQSRNTSYYVWPIRIAGEEGVEEVTLDEPRSAPGGRTGAEKLAHFLGLPLHDSSTGEATVRAPDSLDESLREHAYKTSERVKLPDPPADMRSVITDGMEGTEIAIPGPGLNRLSFLPLILPLFFSLVLYQYFLKDLIKKWPPKDTTEMLVAGFFVFFFIIVPFITTLISIFARARKRAVVTASSTMLRVVEKGLIGKKTTEIPAEELEELVFTESTGKMATRRLEKGMPSIGSPIIARSDTAEVSFGKGLTDEELRYIHALIKKRVTE